VWRTFAFAVGLLVYCVTAALTRDSSDRVSVLVPGTAILGVLTAMVTIRRLQTRAYLSLQLAYLLGAVAARGRAVFDDVYPAPGHRRRHVQYGRVNAVGVPHRDLARSARPGPTARTASLDRRGYRGRR
jgi:hypothetical protein